MVEERISNLKWTYPAFPPRTIKREVLFSLMKYNSAFLLGLYIFIESKRLGKIKIQPSINKGGVKPQELAFKDISIPRGVIFQNIAESIH